MSTSTAAEPVPAGVAPPTTVREDAILLATTSILVAGLFSDGWAHANIVDELEGFVTPWHTVVFLGFLLTAGWILLLVQDRRVPGASLRAAVPPGYELAVLSLLGFFVGFNGDAIWHTVFGIESDIDALLSPTHLLMAAALLAIASTPYRARRPTAAATWRSDGVRVVSLLLTTLVAAFFLLYLWTPSFAIGSVGWEQFLAESGAPDFVTEVSQIAVLGALFAVTVVVLLPVLLLARTGRPPMGAVLLVAVVPAVAVTGIREFGNAWSLLAFLAAGVLAEVVVARTGPGRRQLLLLGALVPLVLWSTYWVLFAVVHGIAWEVELYTGQVMSSVLLGAGAAALLADPVADQAASSPLRTMR